MTAADTSRTLATTATKGLGTGLTERAIQVEAAKVHALLELADAVGRLAVQRPRWDDDLRETPRCAGNNHPIYGYQCVRNAGHEGEHGYAGIFWRNHARPATPDHPEIVTERGQEPPNTTGPVPEATPPIPSPEQAHSVDPAWIADTVVQREVTEWSPDPAPDDTADLREVDQVTIVAFREKWLHAMAERDAARADLAALREVLTGKVRHVYAGLCPDDTEGWDSRDPDCPACALLGGTP